MSPASKFWLGVILLLLIIILIKLPILFFIIFILYLIVSCILYVSGKSELEQLLKEQEIYEEILKQKEENRRWVNNSYKDRAEEIKRYSFYLKFSIIYWLEEIVKSFNNFLNNKFSKNG